jgi:hypothetical protein
VTCTLEDDGAACNAAPTRPYLVGPRCTDHTPARLAGRQDHVPDPTLTLEALQARFAHCPVTPDTRPRLGRFGVEVERQRLGIQREEPDLRVCCCGLGREQHWANGRGNNRGTCSGWAPAVATNRGITIPAAPVCPGCHRHPGAHATHCPMGPRARFAMAADGSIVGTAKRGPE